MIDDVSLVPLEEIHLNGDTYSPTEIVDEIIKYWSISLIKTDKEEHVCPYLYLANASTQYGWPGKWGDGLCLIALILRSSLTQPRNILNTSGIISGVEAHIGFIGLIDPQQVSGFIRAFPCARNPDYLEVHRNKHSNLTVQIFMQYFSAI